MNLLRPRAVKPGFSDVTSLHLAILHYAGLATVYGPSVMCWFGEWPDGVPESDEWFMQALMHHVAGERPVQAPARWSNQARVCLETFKFSKNVREEARAVSLMCAKFLKLDQEGDTDQNCYEIYNQNPTAMRAAWARLPTKEDRARIKASYEQTRRAMLTGSGG